MLSEEILTHLRQQMCPNTRRHGGEEEVGREGREKETELASMQPFSVVVKISTTTTKTLSRLETDRNQTRNLLGVMPTTTQSCLPLVMEQFLHIFVFGSHKRRNDGKNWRVKQTEKYDARWRGKKREIICGLQSRVVYFCKTLWLNSPSYTDTCANIKKKKGGEP